ncbi:MAG TPA: DNA-3-methyladenine glycosylase 2 family protein [Candidatus Bathyarchaeia archaeon]|nr:DNA-3-methyladenine glycosylase 2 family protein [Candidatus Bathyarchaeia archaeon]
MNLKITPVPPFDFHLSATIFSGGDHQIRTYEDGKYWQVVRLNDNLILITITSSGTVDTPELTVELQSNEAITTTDKNLIEDLVRSLFNLPLDLNAFYDEVKTDNVMSTVIRQLRGLKSPTASTVFEALVDSIIEQQISLNVAHVLERNVIKTFGAQLTVDDKVYYAFPTPENIVAATIEELRNCGLSMRKAEYIHDISNSIVEGNLDLENFKTYEDAEAIIKEMIKIRGIGVWTAELTMLRGMHKLEAIPADDLGLRRHIAHYYCDDRKISGNEARRIAENWGNWKGLAGYYLILASRLGVEL